MGFGDGSGISWTICKQSAPRYRQITTPTPHQSTSTDRMFFPTPEGTFSLITTNEKISRKHAVNFVRRHERRVSERTDLLHHRLDFADDVIDAHQRRLAVDAGSDVITAASLRRERFRFVVVGAVRAARRYRPLLYMRYTTTKRKVAVVQSI